jgi:iron complex outermembrane receptor protein
MQTFNDPVTVGSGNILGRWNRTLASGSDLQLQVYYDRFDRVDQAIDETLDTVDLDFQHHLSLGSRQDIVWGLGYRVTKDRITPGYSIGVDPPLKTDNLYSAFLEDEIRLTNSIWLTLGAKVEHNVYSGFEFEPGVRFAWSPNSRQTLWLSMARPIRQPARVDFGVRYDAATFPLANGSFGLVQLVGTPKANAGTMTDYEVGYRAQITKKFSIDIATFRSIYDNLETEEPRIPYFTDRPSPPHVVFPLVLSNQAYARSYGAELFATWNVTDRWRLTPGYSIMHLDVNVDPSSLDPTGESVEGDSPKHQVQLQSVFALRRGLDWGTSIYYVGALRSGTFPGYTRLDTRIGWKIGESIEVGIGAQNLLTARHLEFPSSVTAIPTFVERSVSGRITWRF